MENDDKLMQVKGDELFPGRVLDHLIARRVFGWKSWTFTNPSRVPGDSFQYDALVPPEYDGGMDTAVPAYSTDIAAAWTVLERIGLTFELISLNPGWFDSSGRYLVRFIKSEVDDLVFGNTAPHAICLAALQLLK